MKIYKISLFIFIVVLLFACASYKMINSLPIVLKNYQELYDSILIKKNNLNITKEGLEYWNYNLVITPENDSIKQWSLYFTLSENEEILLYINRYKNNTDFIWSNLEYRERKIIQNKK